MSTGYDAYIDKLIRDSGAVHKAIPAVGEDGAAYRWLNKPVSESLLLDSMESDEKLAHVGSGEMAITGEQPFHYDKCVKLTGPMAHGPAPAHNRSYSRTGVAVECGGMDLRGYNRLSCWVYADCPGFRNVWINMALFNEGEVEGPREKYFENRNGVNVEHGRWSRMVWEIPYVYRDKVARIEIALNNHGSLRDMSDTAVLYFSRLEAEVVEADHYEGWELDGRVAFCHSGYGPGDAKIALTGATGAKEFYIKSAGADAGTGAGGCVGTGAGAGADAGAGETVFTGEVEHARYDTGTFTIMDFSRFTRPGRYYISVDGRDTKPFYIDDNPFRSAVWKLINFFYLERCGFDNDAHIPCHLDCYCVHPDDANLKVPLAGGWHDAGDLSQGNFRTSQTAHAFLDMAERVKGTDNALYERLMEEARWGLNWIAQTRFGDGYRAEWITMGIWTKNIAGDLDDLTSIARYTPFENYCAAAAEAAGAAAFKELDPWFSQYMLKCAVEDFGFACAAIGDGADRGGAMSIGGSQMYGQGAHAAAALYKATGDSCYLEKGAELAKYVMRCQQKNIPDWEGLLPGMDIRGFFYSDEARDNILAFDHSSHEQELITGLIELMEAAPDHTDYALWNDSVLLYCEYIKKTSRMIQPYGLLPAAIYKLDSGEPGQTRRHITAMSDDEVLGDYTEQLKNGIQLSDSYYLRRFPVAFKFRGFHSTLLSKAKAASAAAKHYNDAELAAIARRQIEWTLGFNPFAQSTMYGEGYDFAPLYSEFSMDMTGELPVGIQTFENNDKPYYPMMNHCTYKEIWVQPACRFLWIMADIY